MADGRLLRAVPGQTYSAFALGIARPDKDKSLALTLLDQHAVERLGVSAGSRYRCCRAAGFFAVAARPPALVFGCGTSRRTSAWDNRYMEQVLTGIFHP
jgi:hypothetical protein